MHCMEWREYDSEGKCLVCHNKIVKIVKSQSRGYKEYIKDDFISESDENS